MCFVGVFKWFFSFQIAILNLVSHPHIIELIEVFDFFNEKYLVTELVPGKSNAVLDDVLKRKNLRLAQSSQDLKTSFCSIDFNLKYPIIWPSIRKHHNHL